ncbi:uncharacterized protein C8Q71DRAFT_859745 [Rhodofomes roseus]|uniref:Protein kinase domain-containing protein n=1 Tax=Rhodofomes roseus TaxID=34475 RepID=A0ABQ8KA67_9APHY|nr:uncharacterized protein C8Q71DRAFT_859745 [Rhodofomes roseus]KAH9834072.1 hypothetical protein C8Q71DRAFT_859745 [Rhodofomes roseus]
MHFPLFLFLLSCLTLFAYCAPTPFQAEFDLALRELSDLVQRSGVDDEFLSLTRRADRTFPCLARRGMDYLHVHSDQVMINLRGHQLTLQKFANQGNSHSVVYTVATPGSFHGDFAKTNVAESELAATTAAGAVQLAGYDSSHRRWMIVRRSPGMHITQTSTFRRVAHDPAQCDVLLRRAAKLAAATMMSYWQHTGWLQNDPNLQNVLFDDHMTVAYVIDWGQAIRPHSQPSEAQIEAQAYHMFSSSGFCRSVAPPPMGPPRGGATAHGSSTRPSAKGSSRRVMMQF